MTPETSSLEVFALAEIFARLAERGRKLREAQKRNPLPQFSSAEESDEQLIDPFTGRGGLLITGNE